MSNHSIEKLLERLTSLEEIGVALSAEKNTDRLLEQILLGAKRLTHANAGTLYLRTDDQKLKMVTLVNDELGLKWGGTTGNAIKLDPVPLYDRDGHENQSSVVTCSVLKDQTINIPDAYTAEGFNFTGTRNMDQQTGYRSRSFLTIPLKNHNKEIIGVLQLINRQEEGSKRVIEFSGEDQRLAESLAAQAAVTLTTKELIEEQKQLFEDFIQLIAKAIDEKSPYTGGHCGRVPVIAVMLAEAMNNNKSGKYKDFEFTPEQMYELKIASWLHDCGKVATPEYVMDKATKLETIGDRIREVELRAEIIHRDLQIAALKQQLKQHQIKFHFEDDDAFFSAVNDLKKELEFIKKANIGGEFLSKEDQARISNIGHQFKWKSLQGDEKDFLEEKEISNLQIARGTLNDEERLIINNHVTVTLRMLGSLHYPKGLENVPEIAGSHHERVDGKGYPRNLKGEQMSIQARIVAIADVFEALTAADRPYKKAKSLSESLKILGFMSQEGHIDPHLFKIFIQEKIYLTYAKQYLNAEQIDSVDESKIPGYGSSS